jgi:hypothetical protein
MNERFGVIRGLTPNDAYSLYALLFFRSSSPDGTVWVPDPLDEEVCLGQVSRDEKTGDSVLRYSWRQPARHPAARTGEGVGG